MAIDAQRHLVGYVALGAALLAGAGLAHSAIPDTHKVIHACYDGADGTLHVIDSEAGATCSRTQTALDFNQAGPAGPAGPAPQLGDVKLERAQLKKVLARKPAKPSLKLARQLAAAPAAASEARSTFRDEIVFVPFSLTTGMTVASLGLPAGRWVIHAKANTQYSLAHYSSPTQPPRVFCALRAGADSDAAYATEGTLAPHVVHRFTKPGLAELSCAAFPSDMAIKQIKITAIRVSKLINKPFDAG